MKLYGSIVVHVRGEEVMRQPRFRERVKRAFGGELDLRSGRMRSSIEATAIVEAVRDAMRRLGATDAVALVIDETVLFHDRLGTPDDLGDLFLAFHDNASVFGTGFDELRLAIEHREADLHLVLEVQARSEHPREAAAVRVVISGRIGALTPKPGEDAEAFRARAEPIASAPEAIEMYRRQFETFVGRVRDAMSAAMPMARVDIEVAEPRIVRPGPEAPPAPPDARNYDPYEAYYPGSTSMVASAFLWSTLFSAAHPPHVTVVDSSNHVEGHADDPGIEDGSTAEADEGGSWWESDSGGGSDLGDAGDGGGWWEDLLGGADL